MKARKQRNYVECLQKRKKFLELRLQDNPNHSFDTLEIAALQFALEAILIAKKAGLLDRENFVNPPPS